MSRSWPFGIPLVGSTVAKVIRLTLRLILVDDDGNVGVAGTNGAGVLQPIPSQTFYPQEGAGQAIAFGAVSVNSALLEGNRAHWVFCEDDSCWFRLSNGVIAAAAGDFPLPVGAIAEVTPAPGFVIAVIQRGGAGTLLIGQSEAT